MEIQGIIANKVSDLKGISKQTGEPWRIASYLVTITSPSNSGTMVIDVKDGRSNKIEKLNLQVGKKYSLFINFETSCYNNRWYTKNICWGAREQVITAEDAEAIESTGSPAPQQNNAPATVAEPPAPAPAPEPTPEGEGEGPIDDLPF